MPDGGQPAGGVTRSTRLSSLRRPSSARVSGQRRPNFFHFPSRRCLNWGPDFRHVQLLGFSIASLRGSVADPDPSDPYVFGLLGSGSTNQRYGSGSFYH
jgi:hypothetical protein